MGKPDGNFGLPVPDGEAPPTWLDRLIYGESFEDAQTGERIDPLSVQPVADKRGNVTEIRLTQPTGVPVVVNIDQQINLLSTPDPDRLNVYLDQSGAVQGIATNTPRYWGVDFAGPEPNILNIPVKYEAQFTQQPAWSPGHPAAPNVYSYTDDPQPTRVHNPRLGEPVIVYPPRNAPTLLSWVIGWGAQKIRVPFQVDQAVELSGPRPARWPDVHRGRILYRYPEPKPGDHVEVSFSVEGGTLTRQTLNDPFRRDTRLSPEALRSVFESQRARLPNLEHNARPFIMNGSGGPDPNTLPYSAHRPGPRRDSFGYAMPPSQSDQSWTIGWYLAAISNLRHLAQELGINLKNYPDKDDQRPLVRAMSAAIHALKAQATPPAHRLSPALPDYPTPTIIHLYNGGDPFSFRIDQSVQAAAPR